MQLIGLTGGIASGKTLVSDRFARHGVPVIDADLLAREVVRPGSRGLNALLTHFGTAILTPKGALDRAALREMIFVNPPDRAVVDETLHPLIRERSERRIGEARAAGHGYAVYAVPLLVETDQTARFDRIVVVDVPVEVQLERLLARDGSNDAQARDFMALKGIVAGPRPAIYLGRFSGQCLVQLGLVLATLATVLVAIGVQTPDRLPDSLLAAPFVVLNLMVLLLPWVALMGVCSAVARSPRQATLYAVLAWIVVTLALSLARDAFGPLALFDHVMPGSEAGTLRGLADPATLALLPVPLIQTLVLLALGLFAFGRRDL